MDAAVEDALGDDVDEETDDVMAQVPAAGYAWVVAGPISAGEPAGMYAGRQWSAGPGRRRALTCMHGTPAAAPSPLPRCLQVLDEIGIDLSSQIGAAPKRVAAPAQQQRVEPEEEDELASRLAALK